MPPSAAAQVAIVSRNVETRTHLRDYFESRSLRAKMLTRLPEPDESGPLPGCLILFPDEFAPGEVEDRLMSLLEQLSDVRAVVVTSDTRRFLLLRGRLNDWAQARLSVLPRPAFSWTLFEQVTALSSVGDSMRGL